MKPLLVVEGLSKRYGRQSLFQNVSLELAHGDVLVVTGANGSGKSTFLRCLVGLETPDRGTVSFDGDPRTFWGFSAIDQAVYSNLTVAEHLEFTADCRGTDANVRFWLERIGLAAFADRPAGLLSTGMRARLKLALAAQAGPQILALDEPGAALDADGIALIDDLVREQAERGACILATNDPAERRYGNLELAIGA